MPDGRMQSADYKTAEAGFNYHHRGVCPSFTAHKIKKWDLLNSAGPIFIVQAFFTCNRTQCSTKIIYFGNPYSLSGLLTRIRLRVVTSGAHTVNRSSSMASSGLLSSFSVGCGQSLPQTTCPGAVLI